eukprot:622890_1
MGVICIAADGIGRNEYVISFLGRVCSVDLVSYEKDDRTRWFSKDMIARWNVSIANWIVKNQHWHYITEITWIWNAWSKCEFEPGIASNAKIGIYCMNFIVLWLSCIALLSRTRWDKSVEVKRCRLNTV